MKQDEHPGQEGSAMGVCYDPDNKGEDRRYRTRTAILEVAAFVEDR